MHLLEPTHLIIVLVVVILLFGGKKIPELMHGVGKGMGELQKGLEEGKRNLHNAIHPEEQFEAPKTDLAESTIEVKPAVGTVPIGHPEVSTAVVAAPAAQPEVTPAVGTAPVSPPEEKPIGKAPTP